ncbi:MAG: glycosyltransferase family 2 protein [Desulfurococcaceae archaeon]
MLNTLTENAIKFMVLGITIYSVFLGMGLVGYIFYRPRKGDEKASNVEIVIVSKANEKVKNSLIEVVKYHVKLFNKVTLVVDEDAPLIDMLINMKGVRLVVVPNKYRRDLVGKGRALNYFVEHYVKPDKWYVFIDDDNIIMDLNFLYEIPLYEKQGFVAANGILVPRQGRSKITFTMDWVRYIDDITLYRFFTGLLGKPLIGLHGELMIVKGSVLKEVKFDKKTIAEDFVFAIELVKRGYKTWQSATRVSIKSPNSIRDLMFQRGRWFKGVVSGIKYCPTPMKILIIFRSVTWVLSFIVIILLYPVLSYLGFALFLLPTNIYYIGSYTYGIYKSKTPQLFLLLPFFGLLEASSRLYGLIEVNDFVVIDKN